MSDLLLALALAALNGCVAVLNAQAYGKTGEDRDLYATIAWAGSMLYWLYRAEAGA